MCIRDSAQGALALCVQLLTNPGDTAWLEEPGYRGAKSAFHAGDLNVVAMRVDADGVAISDDEMCIRDRCRAGCSAPPRSSR